VPLGALGLVAFFLADQAPALAQAAVLFLLFVMTGVGGILMPAWMDIVGRSIPTTLPRAVSSRAPTCSGAPAGCSAVSPHVHPRRAASARRLRGLLPHRLRVHGALVRGARVRPRAAGGGRPPPTRPRSRAILAAFRRCSGGTGNLSWFLVARASAAFAMMAGAFYTVYALQTWQAPAWQVGVFTAVLLLGRTIGSIVLGWLADSAGHRLVIIIGVASTIAANALALAAQSVPAFTVVFALISVHFAAVNVSWLPVLLEFAPTVQERPTYVGIGKHGFRAGRLRRAATGRGDGRCIRLQVDSSLPPWCSAGSR